MKKLFKVQYGFSQNESTTIELDEVPKAYYLFMKGEGRAIFKNGVAVRGQDILRIEPDWNATMGWNKTYKLTDDDWNEIGEENKKRFTELLGNAKEVAYTALKENNPNLTEPQKAKELLTEKLKLIA